MRFGKKVGLPVCLADLGVKEMKKTVYEMAKELQNDHFMVNLNCDYSVDVLAGAFVLANRYSKEV
jgi:glycerol dehydrogenase-like iron-containing ADH family enzyme